MIAKLSRYHSTTLRFTKCKNVVALKKVLSKSSKLLIAYTASESLELGLLASNLKLLLKLALKDCIDRDADDVLHRMMDDSSAEQSKMLLGHAGPVYGLSFSPDRTMLLSCSEDGTIRLWSLQTWTCLVVYKVRLTTFPRDA